MADNTGKYTSFKIGFEGDHAAARLVLKEPYNIESSKVTEYPSNDHEPVRRTSFKVSVTSELFDLDGLRTAFEIANDDADLAILESAKDALESFIAENGNTNPYEAADWDAMPALQ